MKTYYRAMRRRALTTSARPEARTTYNKVPGVSDTTHVHTTLRATATWKRWASYILHQEALELDDIWSILQQGHLNTHLSSYNRTKYARTYASAR